jgi:hypothetical protein
MAGGWWLVVGATDRINAYPSGLAFADPCYSILTHMQHG